MNAAYDVAQKLEKSAIVYLTRDQVLSARGDDAQSWLNGQVTADVRTLEPGHGHYALAATVKGRVVSDLWISRADSAIRIVLPELGASDALERLEAHIIMEDVELTREPEQRVITVQGPRAPELRGAASGLPTYDADRIGGKGGFDIVCPAADCDALMAALGAQVTAIDGAVADHDAWAGAHVLLARPRLGIDFGPESYPQEAGLKDRALSFNKGCYQGQEVIYMLEKRGQLARRLVQLELESTEPPAAGQPITAEGAKVGEITSAVAAGQDRSTCYALGYLKRPQAELDHAVTVGSTNARVRSVIGLTETTCPIVAG